MRPNGSAEELERRRRRAVELVGDGVTITEAARIVDAHRRTVQRWMRRYEKGGKKALDPKPHPGGISKLRWGQKQQLTRALLKGAESNGFPTDLWTCDRVRRLTWRKFHVRYHEDHIGRLLKGLGWTLQKPERKAYERDEEEIQRWIHEDWPRIKKSRARRRAHRIS